MLRKLYNPAIFQGNLRKKNYFEGWYFKQVTHNLEGAVSIIPGISLAKNDPHAFIQIMNGTTGESYYVRYLLNEFKWDRRKFLIKIGSSVFTEEGIDLNIRDDAIFLTGKIEFSNLVRYPSTVLSPGIMGWYSFVPFMECNHGIVSVTHDLHGEISYNGDVYDFEGGRGYIEKDWGISFPEAWIWIQSNVFNEHTTSFCMSIAKIPWMGSFFIGFISFLYFNDRFYVFATYNKSTFSIIHNNTDGLVIDTFNRDYKLNISVLKNSFYDLKAPVAGEMSRGIKESIDSEVHLQLSERSGKDIYHGTGRVVGLEIIEEIFNYVKPENL